MKKLLMAAVTIGGTIWLIKAIQSGVANQVKLQQNNINNINAQI